MDPNYKLVFVVFLVICLPINGVTGYATVTGLVFCDQCKDGELSLFDFPVSGVKISVTCPDENGQVNMLREETTNWLGGYVMRFDGIPDLSNCKVQVSDNGTQQDPTSCSIAYGPAQNLQLVFNYFGYEIFSAYALLAQPVQPMPACPTQASAPVMSPPNTQAPVMAPTQVPVLSPPPATSPPQFKLPPLPPFEEPSACPHQMWVKPEYRCYWRAIGPDTKVAAVFGQIAGRRYGTDMTIMEALNGGGEDYKSFIREATTALLNSYNSLGFTFSSISVITKTNLALLSGSKHDVILTAFDFLYANSGICKFTICK